MTRIFTDQMGRTVELSFPPKRIVSLVPSQTELLYDLGLGEEVAGQTIFCIHPAEMHATKPRVGGTKKLQFDKIAALQPDLIIGNKEENEQVQTEKLVEQYPVWMSDIKTLGDAIGMIGQIGELVDRKSEAVALSAKISSGFGELEKLVVSRIPKPVPVLYLIWRDPWMAAGHDTFITDMLACCGLSNVATGKASRYPELTNEMIAELSPALILLSSEPYPFKDVHIQELQRICPRAEILLVDGEMFSWYGSRLLLSLDYFESFIHRIAADIKLQR